MEKATKLAGPLEEHKQHHTTGPLGPHDQALVRLPSTLSSRLTPYLLVSRNVTQERERERETGVLISQQAGHYGYPA